MKIAIIGATGMLGKPVTDELISAGLTVRVVARNVSAAKALFPTAEVVAADLQQPATLVSALVDCETVYLNLSVKQTEKSADFHTESDGLRNLLAAAKAAGVRRVAYLSSIVMRYQGMNGFDWWVFRIKQEAVQLIKASGLDYSIFYPSNFMETLLATQRMGPLVLVVGKSTEKPWFIAAHDYGKQVACALKGAKAGQAQEYVIQGPEAVTQWEAARRLIRAYTEEKLWAVVMPTVLLRLSRFFSQQAAYGYHIGEALNRYPEQFEAQRTWNELGKPTTTIEEFAVNGKGPN